MSLAAITTATASPAPSGRRAPARAPHLCRGRGGRGCRCHVAARPRQALLSLAGGAAIPRREALREDPHAVPAPVLHSPRRPQAPPCPV